ncbi:MAG: hypothetical protein GF401_12640 [Chitinivibrionales bacterium]|nr:hypothetical protein [Chitinivibrionales bacterium]
MQFKLISIITLLLVHNSFSQHFESNPLVGVTLPIGAEVGFLTEASLPFTSVTDRQFDFLRGV